MQKDFMENAELEPDPKEQGDNKTLGALPAKKPQHGLELVQRGIAPTIPGGVWGNWAGSNPGKPGAGTQGRKQPCREARDWELLSDRKMKARLWRKRIPKSGRRGKTPALIQE